MSTAIELFRKQIPTSCLCALQKFEAWQVGYQPKFVASLAREIAPDTRSHVTALRVDVDDEGGATAWMDAEVPQPSLTVINPKNGHAHLIWMLGGWIETSNVRAMQYAKRVRTGLTVATGGDLAYASRFHHNPLHGDFQVIEGPIGYDLSDLAQYVDMALPRSATVNPVENAGRHSYLFDACRKFAYSVVDAFRTGKDWEGFDTAVLRYVWEQNRLLPKPLDVNEADYLAHHVARWTWRRYKGRSKPRYAKTRAQHNAEQIAAKEQRMNDALRLIEQGFSVAQAADAIGITRQSVYRYLGAQKLPA